jgi:hypothetical protein
MTTLGKILVIVNLVFSVVTGALIIMIFITRTNWREGFEKEAANNKALQEKNTRLAADMKSVRDETDRRIQTVGEELNNAKKDLEQARKQAKELQDSLVLEQGKSKADANAHGVIQSELERRRAEVTRLEKRVADAELDIAKLQQDNREQRAVATKNQLDADSLRVRNAQLMDQLSQMAQDIERRKSGASGVAGGGMPNNPPPEDVRGVIKALDASSGLVTISLGSDAGLSVGNTLEAFRFKPRPTYLGRIQLVDVRHHDAVGKLISTQRRGLVQIGDEVASRIMGER